MKLLTASKLPLAKECTWWLRDEAEWGDDEPGEAARIGSAVGRAAELSLSRIAVPSTLWADYKLGANATSRAKTLWGHLSAWLADNAMHWWLPEVPFAYGPRGARVLPPGKSHRDYRVRNGEMFAGTVDVLDVTSSGVHIYDFKCTREVDKYWPQLEGLACVAAIALERRRRVGLIPDGKLVRHWVGPRESPPDIIATIVHVTDRGVKTYDKYLDVFDMLTFQDDMNVRFGSSFDFESMHAREGYHCGQLWCPARASCPAQQSRKVVS